MNFFEHQARARRRTWLYVTLFAVAVALIVGAANLAVTIAAAMLLDGSYSYLYTGELIPVPSQVMQWTTGITLCAIGAAIAYRLMSLSGGGSEVARQMGGTLVDRSTRDPKRRQLMNVVEETAIAAGVPVPQVFVLEGERGLNAFAAGFGTSDAAIAVTRGLLEHLTRDELQGVIGHEFSHILNGDMRLNTRLIGVLFGILFIGLIGRVLLRTRGRGALPFWTLGLSLVVIGYIGVLFGQMIQAAISRSRERLADASAVQFTRNPRGLAGALKKIAVLSGAFRVPRAAEVSHMLIADRAPFASFFSSHPPILERIRALEPGFRESDLAKVSRLPLPEPPPPPMTSAQAASLVAAVPIAAAAVVDAVGHPDKRALDLAAERLQKIPENLRQIAHTQDDALPLTLAFVLSASPAERVRQLEIARKQLALTDSQVVRADFLADQIARLDAACRLPLFELAFPSLRACPAATLRALASAVDAIANIDGVVSVFEYAFTRLLRRQLYEVLAPQARRAQMVAPKLYALREEVQALLSVLAREGAGDMRQAHAAYDAGVRKVFPMQAPPYLLSADWKLLDRALTRLDFLAPHAKQQLIEAVALTISHDHNVTLGEFELLRAVCASLHCPVPLLVVSTAGQAAA